MPVGEERAATKSELAYARVRELVLTGELAPGTVLNQATLARQIGISTTPLREALRRLAQQGLVELGAHRDARVAPLDATEARDLVELRQDLAEMTDSLARLESLPTDPSPAQLAGHHRFHAALYRASHNALLVATLDGLWDKTDRYRRHALRTGRSDEEVAQRAEEHRLLVEAVEDRDAAAATDLMRRHVETSLAARAAGRLASETRPRPPA